MGAVAKNTGPHPVGPIQSLALVAYVLRRIRVYIDFFVLLLLLLCRLLLQEMFERNLDVKQILLLVFHESLLRLLKVLHVEFYKLVVGYIFGSE